MLKNINHSRFMKIILILFVFILVTGLTTAWVKAEDGIGQNEGDGRGIPS